MKTQPTEAMTPDEIENAMVGLTEAQKRRAKALVRRLKPDAAPAVGLYEFIPAISPKYEAPRHLHSLVVELERAWYEPVRVAAHAPPRFAKTDTVLAFIALTLKRFPEKTIGYITYEDRTAKSKSRKARMWALSAGVELAEDAAALNEWRTTTGGGVLATGIGGPLTSQGVDILIIDDPYKNRIQAESGAYREMVSDWWGDVAETRVEPGGSVFIFHTRWVEDDLIGHVLRGEDGGAWKHIVMPAIGEDGKSLWPARWSTEALEQKRRSVGEYTWSSLFQGQPRSRGGRLFGGVHFYEELPKTYQEAFGVDLAYTKKTHADRSIAIGLREHGGFWYLTSLRRRQVKAPEFSAELVALAKAHPSAGFRWYCSGTELGSAAFMQQAGVPLAAMPTTSDKFIRAQPVAAMWNAGKVLIPRKPTVGISTGGISQEDLDEFVRVVCGFTGVNDAEDDDVDALAAAFDQLQPTEAVRDAPQLGTRAWQDAEAQRMREALEERAQREAEEELEQMMGGVWPM